MNGDGRILRPFRKLLNRHLSSQNLERQPEGRQGWLLRLPNQQTRIDLDNVWLQGVVKNVSKDNDTIEIADDVDGSGGNGGVLIIQCRTVPGGQVVDQQLKGKFCQVLGEVVDHLDEKVHGGKVRVRAVKVVDLSKLPNADVLKLMWPQEVDELIKVICGQKEDQGRHGI